MASSRELEEGRRRFHAGDYRGAVDSFRSAVAAYPEDPAAQAWFAVGLVALGEGRNADKALRSAAAGGLVSGTLSLEGLFRDDKERVRVIVALAKVVGDGGLAAAYALALSGEPARLKQLAEKDPVARQLLPKP
jgi:tetratricopeptide (TPR) repeat protein